MEQLPAGRLRRFPGPRHQSGRLGRSAALDRAAGRWFIQQRRAGSLHGHVDRSRRRQKDRSGGKGAAVPESRARICRRALRHHGPIHFRHGPRETICCCWIAVRAKPNWCRCAIRPSNCSSPTPTSNMNWAAANTPNAAPNAKPPPKFWACLPCATPTASAREFSQRQNGGCCFPPRAARHRRNRAHSASRRSRPRLAIGRRLANSCTPATVPCATITKSVAPNWTRIVEIAEWHRTDGRAFLDAA